MPNEHGAELIRPRKPSPVRPGGSKSSLARDEQQPSPGNWTRSLEQRAQPSVGRHVVTAIDMLAGSAQPMEAKLVSALPTDGGWQFEPKWDGFRAMVARVDGAIAIQSKSGKSLARYFPEIVAMLADLPARRFLLDGELILPIGGVLSFDALQQRLHPAASRIEKLSRETPAQLMLFDCLVTGDQAFADHPLSERRLALERFYSTNHHRDLLLSPATTDPAQAQRWFERSGSALDGVVIKRLDERYRWGERAMGKLKVHRSADCVVGGFRRANDGAEVVSMLLGLYNEDRLLDHVGFTSAIAHVERPALTRKLDRLAGGAGFTGKAPGGASRWSQGKDSPWEPLTPSLVVEVRYDQVTGRRFRHGTRFLRWRPDKAPEQCTMDQLQHEVRPAELEALLA